MTKLALALNVGDSGRAVEWLDRVGNRVDCYKLQMDLFGRGGPELVRQFTRRGAGVFLDLKFHDIPSVVASAVETAAELGVAMLTVHAAGGSRMMAAAAEAAKAAGARRPLVLGVTVLTSLDEAELARVTGCRQAVVDRVTALAELARVAGCDGVVASPVELPAIKQRCGKEFTVVTPGIRLEPAGPGDDQARVMTPAQAARAGADWIVVGRPIYGAADPLAAIAAIRRQLEEGR